MHITIFFIAMFSLVLPKIAIAEESRDCIETAMTQTDINICAGSKNGKSSEVLEKLVLELKSILPDEPEANLVASQKAWAKVVENDCKIESWYLGNGSARSMVVSNCYASHSSNRIKTLLPLLCHPMISTCEERAKYEKGI